jgi:hypothetical protein
VVVGCLHRSAAAVVETALERQRPQSVVATAA